MLFACWSPYQKLGESLEFAHPGCFLLFFSCICCSGTYSWNSFAFKYSQLKTTYVRFNFSRCLLVYQQRVTVISVKEAVLGQDKGPLLSSSVYQCWRFYWVSLTEHDSFYV